MKKVILAFSGGLDTSFSIPYLKSQGYEVITVTVDTGGFSHGELVAIEKKAMNLGALKQYTVDSKKYLFDTVAAYIIQTHGLYQDSYPNMCADRYCIAEACAEIAKKEHATAIAHGATSMGNDQVRFDTALMTIAPDFEILTPIREFGGDRKKEQAYLEQHGFAVSTIHKKYSVNQNLLGITYSGSELDTAQEPDQSLFLWTKQHKAKLLHITIDFANGKPSMLVHGKKIEGWQVIQELNVLLGSYGYGKAFYTGDCVIGIKGHIAFEAPGMFALIQSHTALQQLVLTKPQQEFASIVSHQLTDLLYTGKFYEPAVTNLKAAVDSLQEYMTGTVVLSVSSGCVHPVAVTSPYTLIQPTIASYAQGCSWTPADAKGFIFLHGLQSKIATIAHVHAQKGVI